MKYDEDITSTPPDLAEYYAARAKVEARKTTVTDPSDIQRIVLDINDSPIEIVVVIALNNRNKVIGQHRFIGTADSCTFAPRDVFRWLVTQNAVAFVMAHNHPGGSIEPSEADWKVTKKLIKGGELVDIPILDHVILGNGYTAMRAIPRWTKDE